MAKNNNKGNGNGNSNGTVSDDLILNGSNNQNKPDTLTGGSGNDTINGLKGDDFLFGQDGNDTINGGDGDDTINAGNGWDDIEGGAGADAIDGGAGENDAADYVSSDAGVTVNLQTNVNTGGHAEGDTLLNIEFLYGSMYDDNLTGDDSVNRLVGRLGDDTLNGGGGDDTLIGGRGADTLIGGSGTDTADYGWSGEGVTVHLGKGVGLGGDAHGDTLTGIENIMGSDFDDKLTGDDGTNRLNGGAGDDILRGGNGKDYLVGGAGEDVLDGGNGNNDVADYTYADASVVVDLSTGVGSAGEADGDTYIGIEYVYGSQFDDTITGDDGVNRLVGHDGNDTINGGGGNDYILGESGNDILTGGSGADVFLFHNADEGNDVITDFWAGAGRTDRIWVKDNTGLDDFSDVLANMVDTVDGTLLTTLTGTILFEGLEISDFVADDFIF